MIISIIFFILMTVGLGLPLVLLICPKSNYLIKLGLSYPVGFGAYTLLMWGLNISGIKFSLFAESLLLISLSVPFILLKKNQIAKLFITIINMHKTKKLDSTEKLLLAIISFFVLSSFINTFYWPVYMWDSVVLYDYRAHLFVLTGFMKDVFINEYYYSYPPLTSLAHTIVYLAGGRYPEFIYSLFYTALGISFFGFLREIVSRKLSLFYTALLLITGPLFDHSLYSYTNLTYAIYLSLGTILLYLWDKKNDMGYLILSAFLVGISLNIRPSEPFWMALYLTVIIFSVIKKRWMAILFFPLIVLPLKQIWLSYQKLVSNGMVVSIGDRLSLNHLVQETFNIGRWGQVLSYLYEHVVVVEWPLYMLFILSIINVLKKKNTDNLLLPLVILLFMGVLIMGTFIFSIYLDYWSRIGDATERLSMLFYPLLIYFVAISTSRVFQKKTG